MHQLNEAELLICKEVKREFFPKKGWIGITTLDPAGNPIVHDVFTRHGLQLEVKKLLDKFGKDLLKEINERKPIEGSGTVFISHEHAEDQEAAKGLVKAFLVSQG